MLEIFIESYNNFSKNLHLLWKKLNIFQIFHLKLQLYCNMLLIERMLKVASMQTLQLFLQRGIV